jgi:predicted methyltransferase
MGPIFIFRITKLKNNKIWAQISFFRIQKLKNNKIWARELSLELQTKES